MACQKMREEMPEESTSLALTIEHRIRTAEEVEETAVAEQREEEVEILIRKHCLHQQLSQCAAMKSLTKGKWRYRALNRSQPALLGVN